MMRCGSDRSTLRRKRLTYTSIRFEKRSKCSSHTCSAISSPSPANFEAVGAGNHDVEDDRVVGIDRRLIERGVAVAGCVHRVSRLAQTAGEDGTESRIVFHDE